MSDELVLQNASSALEQARELAAAGRHAEVVEVLGNREREVEGSPQLALLYGTAHARLGHHAEGLKWLDVALSQARKWDEQEVELHALNARGAVALVSGRLDEAAECFTQGLMAAGRDNDLINTARCSNNLGIISHLRGRHAEAIGSWKIAAAAFQRAHSRVGVAECHYNLAIAYREQDKLDAALAASDHAVYEAAATRDRTLRALTLRGRAELWLARGEPDKARNELAQVQAMRSRLLDPVGESEDLRVLALLLAAENKPAPAEQALREVMRRAEVLGRPQLLAEATRDLAALLRRTGRREESREAWRAAKTIFTELRAEGELRRLAGGEWDDRDRAELRASLEPLPEAQEMSDAGRYHDLLRFLEGRSEETLDKSPMMSMLRGIAHNQLGQTKVGRQWAHAALNAARVAGDRRLEVRTLNACGAVALEQGGIEAVARFFAEEQEHAALDSDMVAVGRGANNLGVVAIMRGEYDRAHAAFTFAIQAYEQANYRRGVAESHHNLGVAHRELGQLDQALESSARALRAAELMGDMNLKAMAIAGRAEIQIARGEPDLAIWEAQRALGLHSELNDAAREAEDLRIVAVALDLSREVEDAEDLLRDVIARADDGKQPMLMAMTQRDLAKLLDRTGEHVAAGRAAETARALFAELGATGELAKLAAWHSGRAPC